MSTPTRTTAAARPRRRWLRFSLRNLLLLTLLVAAALGWTIHKAREQGIAVAELRRLGCEVSFGPSDDIEAKPPDFLERLRALLGEKEPRNVTRVDAMGSEFNDSASACLRGM